MDIQLPLMYGIEFIDKCIKGSILSICDLMIQFPLEALLLSTTGIISPLLSNAWYISSMFWGIIVIAFLLFYLKKPTKYIFSWLVPFLYYGFMKVHNRTGATIDDLLRAFSCMMLGVFLYYVSMYIKYLTKRINQRAKIVFNILTSVIEVGFLIRIFLFVHDNNMYPEKYSMIIPMFAVLIILLFSDFGWTQKLSFGFFNYLGEMSLPLYLFQRFVASGIIKLGIGTEHHRYILFVSITMLTSCIYVLIIRCLRKRNNKSKSSSTVV